MHSPRYPRRRSAIPNDDRSSAPDDKAETVMTPLIPLLIRPARFQVPGLQVPGLQVPGLQVPGSQVPGLQVPNLSACIFTILVTLAASTVALPVQGGEPPSCPGCAAAPALPTADIVPDPPTKPPVPPNDPAVQARLPGCAVWTDRCVTCSRTAGGASCSNIGIACQPQPVECLQSEEEAKKLDEKPAKKQEN
jgi:hypothetical protein